MTVDEAIQKANEGDVASMVALGDYYGQNKDYNNALVWYRKAAEQGNLQAMYRAFLLDCMALLARVEVHPSESDDAVFHEINRYAKTLQKFTDVDLEPHYTDSKYNYADSLHYRDNYTDLLSLVQDESQPRFRVMYALALNGIAGSLSNDDEKIEYYKASSDILREVLHSGYIPANDRSEQVHLAIALGTYTDLIRVGMFANADVAGAYHILTSQMENLTNENAKSVLSLVLKHYQVKKGFFGTSITYID